jgi:uncharacterized protein DUF5670
MGPPDRKARATDALRSWRAYRALQHGIEAVLPGRPDRTETERVFADVASRDICRGYRQFAHRASMARPVRTYPPDERDPTLNPEEGDLMLWTIFVILLVLWAVGMVSSYTLGGFIHLLLLIAIAVVLIRIIQGRRPV